MEADIVGLQKILDTIKGSGFTKCTVFRYPQNSGNIPVFEKLTSKNAHDLLNSFSDWGRNIDNSVLYEINLFDDLSVVVDEFTGQEKQLKNKTKNGKAKFYIQFKKEASINGSTNNDLATIVGLVSENLKKSQEDNLILKEISDLKSKITELEEEEEEDQDNGLGAITPSAIMQVISAIQSMNKNNQAPAINGVDEVDDFKININKAIRILHKYDPQLDQDLLKLSHLAENNNSTFKMLLSTLRSM